jgi:Putative Actinobacterial Holin-X, holin superfamily III
MSETRDQLALPDRADDWPAQATERIVKTVDAVRTQTTDRAIVAARAVVFGLLAAILGVAAVVLLTILLVRIVDNYVPGPVYWAYLIVGGVFFLAGLIVFSMRTRKPQPQEQ